MDYQPVLAMSQKPWLEPRLEPWLYHGSNHPRFLYASTFRVMARFDGKLSALSMTNYAILYYKKFIADDFG